MGAHCQCGTRVQCPWHRAAPLGPWEEQKKCWKWWVMPFMFFLHVPVAGEEHLSWKTQPWAGACQEYGFENPDSDLAAFAISVVIKQQNQHSERQKRPIFSISKKPNSSEIKLWANDRALWGLRVLHRPRRPAKNTVFTQQAGKVKVIKALSQRSFLVPHGERNSVALFPLFHCVSVTTNNFPHSLDVFRFSPGETSGLGFYCCHSFHFLSSRRCRKETSKDGGLGALLWFSDQSNLMGMDWNLS